MDSFDHIAPAGTPDVRLSPAGPGPAGDAASAADPGVRRGERRAARLASLARARELTEQAAGRLVEYMHGQLSGETAQPFAHIADPCQALDRMTRSIRQIVALEEKLDEDEETRARRLREEAEARHKAEERQKRTPEEALRERKRKSIRYAVRNALRDSDPDMDREDRERLLDDLFSDRENYDDEYAGDPAAIVLELCREAGISLAPPGEDAASEEEGDADPMVAAEAYALAVARRYLAAVAPDLCPPEVDDEPSSRGRGPP